MSSDGRNCQPNCEEVASLLMIVMGDGRADAFKTDVDNDREEHRNTAQKINLTEERSVTRNKRRD